MSQNQHSIKPLLAVILLGVLWGGSFFARELSHFFAWEFALTSSLLILSVVITACLFLRHATLGLGAGAIAGFLMFPLSEIITYMAQYETPVVTVSDYPSFITALIPLSLLYSFAGLFILFSILKVSGSLDALIFYITKYCVLGRKSAKAVTFILGILFYTGGTTSSVAVSTVMKPIALRYISPEELSAIIDMTSSPVALVFQKYSYWGVFLAAMLVTPNVPFLKDEILSRQFLNHLVLSVCILPNILMLLIALLISLDRFPSFLLSKRFKRAIEAKRHSTPLSQGENTAEKSMTICPYLASITLLSLFTLFIGSAFWGFESALLLSLMIAFVLTFFFLSKATMAQIQSKNQPLNKLYGLGKLMFAVEEGILQTVPILLILFLAAFVAIFLKMTGITLYLSSGMSGQINYIYLPFYISVITFLIAYVSGTSFGTYKIMLTFVPSLAYSIALGAGLSPEQSYLFLQIVIASVLVSSVQADQSSLISDTTIIAAKGSGCSVMEHFLTQMPIVAGMAIFTLLFNTLLTWLLSLSVG